MPSEESVIEQPDQQEGTGTPGTWVDDLNDYLGKKPTASDEELYKKFPQLNKDSKRLDAALSYGHAKAQGMSDDEARKLYPDLLPASGFIDQKNKVTVQPAPTSAPAEGAVIPKIDSNAYLKNVQPAAAESTAGGSEAIKRQAETNKASEAQRKKLDEKYTPMIRGVMDDIEAHKDQFVENRRPALDFHRDAPDSFYEVPKMSAVDAYLKEKFPDTDARYYIRNKIISQFQQNKDSYYVQGIAKKHIDQMPAVVQARQELNSGGKIADEKDVMKRAGEIDPELENKVTGVYQKASASNEDIKNETTRMLINNSTSLHYDDDGILRKVNTLDPNAPFHDQITGAGKAVQGFMKFSGQVGEMASGLLKFFGAKEPAYSLQKIADDVTSQEALPGGDQTLTEGAAGEALPMVLQGIAMGKFARGLGAPAFRVLAGAEARGLIGKAAEGALGGVALAPINSAVIAHQYYNSLVRAGETPEIAQAKSEHVFEKNLVADMAISPLQFGIMNAPVNNAIAKVALQYGVSPVIAGGHFMAMDYFQQKENNPALTAWQYATSTEGIKTGIAGALTGLVQHYVIGKMNDWQNSKNLKDAFSFGRKDASPETENLPNNNVIANTVLNAFEMKDHPGRAGELKGLINELHGKGVYNDQEAAKINGIIDDVASVKALVPKLGTAAQRMAVFNELLNKQGYAAQIPEAGNSAVQEMFEGKMKESDQRIQKIMNDEEPLYFVNGNETSKEQLKEWVKDNQEKINSDALKIDIIGDPETQKAIYEAKNQPGEPASKGAGDKEAAAGKEVPGETPVAGTTGEAQIVPSPDEKNTEPQPLTTSDEGINTPVPGRSAAFSDFYHNFKDEIGAVKDSSFDFRLDIPMDQKTREGAVKDIQAGKVNSKRAKLFLDELEKQHDNGMIEYTRGRGNHVEKFGIPVEDWNKVRAEAEHEVYKDIATDQIPEDELVKWLQEEAGKINENEPEPATSEAGHPAGDTEERTAQDEHIRSVREGDEAETGAGETLAEDDSHPLANRAPGFVRAPGSSETTEPAQASSGSAADPLVLPTREELENHVRDNLDSLKDSTLKKTLADAGMTDEEATAMIGKIRAEQDMSPEDVIRNAIAIGKASAKNKAPELFDPKEARQLKPGLLKTLKRWYYDGKDEVSDVKSIIRKNKGQEEFEIDQIYHATKKLLNSWNTVPKVKQMAFILGVENPELLKNQPQDVKDMATAYRARLDKTFETIGQAMPDLNYIEDYFPHFWDKPEEVRNFFASTMAKAPLEGNKSFAKKRFFETIVAGLKANYKLSTTNPEEMTRLAEANAWKFKSAHDIFRDMKDKGYLKYSISGDKPEGWKTVDDPIFTKMAAVVDKNGNPDLLRGAYYMPGDVAKLVNDYLSIGLKGPVKGFIQQYNNIKNLFQLGVGFFHFGTTTTDAIVTGMTNGIQKLTALNPKGLLDIATFGNLPATVIRGFKARADWNAGRLTKDVQSLIDANAKVGRQKMYSIDAKYKMMKAFGQLRADADFKQLPKALWNAMLFLPEAINKPLMEHWVPSLKVGGYLRSLDSEISSRKNMTPAELQNAKQKIWDSMDDRLGQVVYDNIFVNKVSKDLAFMAIRSAGWTGGTIRAVSGGLAEIPRSAGRVVRGQGLSQRTAYLAALPLTVGLMGAFYQYLMTGQPPDEMKDYFFPKDGTKSPDGTDHRVDFPSYMKDILAYRKQPVNTLLHKTSPFLNDLVELYQNKDFYGERVYNKDDPFYQKGLDILKHEGETMEPFSFKKNPYDESPFIDQVTTRPGLEKKFGIMPAPKERERSDLQNKISQAYSDQIGKDEEGKTHAEMEQQIARRHLREFIFNGGNYKDASEEWKEKAGLAPKALGKFIHDSQMDPYERYFKQLRPATKIGLYQDMSEDDKAKYGKWIPIADRAKANQPKQEE